MPVLDSYSPCPCGSGQKYKWCCQKVEAYADRSLRLYETGQTAAAIDALDEGLRKEPGNSWLLNRKALMQVRLGKPEDAKTTIREVLGREPNHLGSLVLMTRLVLETEGSSAGAAQLQQALSAYGPEKRRELASLVKVVGAFLAESGDYPAALKHLRLAQSLMGGQVDPQISGTIRMIEGNPAIIPWLKNPDQLSPAPETLKGEALNLFNEALRSAESGLWGAAASLFSTLATDPVAGPTANRNHGFTRLWLANYTAAATALRRYAATLGPTTEAVDIEALCQSIVPPGPADLVERVQLTWPIRSREHLLKALHAEPSVFARDAGEDDEELDETESDSGAADAFVFLSGPYNAKTSPNFKVEDISVVLGQLAVGKDTVSLTCIDDGRLEALSDRFTTIAGPGIPPAHPKTKVVEKVSTLQVALTWEWVLPQDMDNDTATRLHSEKGRQVILDVWPNIKMSSLHGRTPKQAAKAGDSPVPLRAALCQLEQTREGRQRDFNFADFRRSLGVELEPIPDVKTVDVSTLHLARLNLVPVDGLDDANLVTLYRRSRQAMMAVALEKAAVEICRRPEAVKAFNLDSLTIYSDLAMIAMAQGRRDEAMEILKQGRNNDAPESRIRNAPTWDMLEIRMLAQVEEPTRWVGELAIVLERYRDDQAASQALTVALIDMGVIRVVPNPDRQGEIMIDSSPLQALLAQYGPRVTTASGRLGVSATKPEIWTPGGQSTSGGSKGIWTPGSQPPAPTTAAKPSTTPPPASPGGSKLIIPGR